MSNYTKTFSPFEGYFEQGVALERKAISLAAKSAMEWGKVADTDWGLEENGRKLWAGEADGIIQLELKERSVSPSGQHTSRNLIVEVHAPVIVEASPLSQFFIYNILAIGFIKYFLKFIMLQNTIQSII